ncbi:MAG: cupin, partial [Candidatus Latescibacterota bacterium]
DHILIPAHKKHRVTHTSTDPPCIWLAIHGSLTSI